MQEQQGTQHGGDSASVPIETGQPSNGAGAETQSEPLTNNGTFRTDSEYAGFQPPPAPRRPLGVWDSIRSSPLIMIAAVVIITGAGLAVAFTRHQKYSASAQLAVLHVNFGAAGSLGAYTTAAPELADTYARSITADGVVDPLAAQFHTSPTTIRDELTAASVPASPVLTVTATTVSQTSAVALANAASTQLTKYLQAINSQNPDTIRLYRRLADAEANLAKQRVAQQTLLSAIAAHDIAIQAPHGTLNSSEQAQLSRTDASLAQAEDLVSGDRASYQQNLTATSATQYLQQLQSASTASGNRKSRLALYGFIALAVGIAVGVGLCLLVAARRRARLTRKLRAA